MSVVNYVFSNPTNTQAYALTVWSGLTGGDTGQPFLYTDFADRTVQVSGTIGAAITIQGTLDIDLATANWETLSDNFGNPLSFTTHGISLITEAPLYIRPSCAAGTTNAKVSILANVS